MDRSRSWSGVRAPDVRDPPEPVDVTGAWSRRIAARKLGPRWALLAVAVAATTALLSGCGHRSGSSAPPATQAAGPAVTPPGASDSPSSPTPAVAASTLVATTRGTIPRFSTPGGPQVGTVPATWFGTSSALPVIAVRPGWVDVRMAQRPNESTAWVLKSDVALASTPYRIIVDLATTHLTLYRGGHVLFSVPIGIGNPTSPTPTGHFFVALLAAPPLPGMDRSSW